MGLDPLYVDLADEPITDLRVISQVPELDDDNDWPGSSRWRVCEHFSKRLLPLHDSEQLPKARLVDEEDDAATERRWRSTRRSLLNRRPEPSETAP